MKSIQLLKQAESVLGGSGEQNEQDTRTTLNDISLFFEDQARRAAADHPGMRVSTDGVNWEYGDTAHVVSRIQQPGQTEMKEFSMSMTAGTLSMDVRSTISSETSAGTITIDYEALSTFGIEGITTTEPGQAE